MVILKYREDSRNYIYSDPLLLAVAWILVYITQNKANCKVSEAGDNSKGSKLPLSSKFLNTYTNYEIYFQKAEEPKLDDISIKNRPEDLATISTKNPAFSVSLNFGGGELTNENYPLAKGQVISEYNFGVSLELVPIIGRIKCLCFFDSTFF